MNQSFFSDDLEARIAKEIRLWSSSVLEKPNPYFNNLPPCPYARSAWMKNKVAIVFNHENNYQSLYSCISQFDEQYEIAVLVDLGNVKNADDFHEYLDSLNQVISEGMFIDKDIWLMGFHPEDEPSDFVEEIEFDHSHISGGISKINTADNVFGIFTSRAMRERGRYQIQCMK